MFRRFVVLVAVGVLAMTAVGCAKRAASEGNDTYVSVYGKHPIDVNAPINPYNGRGNASRGTTRCSSPGRRTI